MPKREIPSTVDIAAQYREDELIALLSDDFQKRFTATQLLTLLQQDPATYRFNKDARAFVQSAGDMALFITALRVAAIIEPNAQPPLVLRGTKPIGEAAFTA